MKIDPTGSNVLIKPKEHETVTSGGIHLPDNARKAAVIEGEVMAAGPKCRDLKSGMTVCFDKHSATMRHVRLDTDKGEVKLLIMKEADVMGYYE